MEQWSRKMFERGPGELENPCERSKDLYHHRSSHRHGWRVKRQVVEIGGDVMQ